MCTHTHTLTVFLDSLTMSTLASSALSLFRHTMWTVPPGQTKEGDVRRDQKTTGGMKVKVGKIGGGGSVPDGPITLTPTLTRTKTPYHDGLQVQTVPLFAMAIAVVFPMPLLAPVIRNDLPTTDTSSSFATKFLDAASYPFLLGVTYSIH